LLLNHNGTVLAEFGRIAEYKKILWKNIEMTFLFHIRFALFIVKLN
jgi:hypothetical protein